MLLPNGSCVWQGLNTFFVDMRNLIKYIRLQDFNGYIYCRFSNAHGVIFINEGDALCGVLGDGKSRKRGKNVVKEILDFTQKEKNIQLDVYSLSVRAIEIITDLFLMEVKPYQTNLSADFLNIESYVNNHLSNLGFSGYIEIQFKEGDDGFVSFVDGQLYSIVTNSLQIRRDKAKQSELKVFDMYALKTFERANSKGARYDVYAKY